MRRWNIRAVLLVARARPTLRTAPAASRVRHLSTAESEREGYRLPPHEAFRRNAIFERIERPERRIDAWIALLDGALPPHLRDWKNDASPPTLSAIDVATVLLEAQHPRKTDDEAFDLLFDLGFNQNRWHAVVWLVKQLVEKFPVRHKTTSQLTQINAIWDQVSNLEEALDDRLELKSPGSAFTSRVAGLRRLDELTLPGDTRHMEILGHEALGQIWRTLGAMTKACAGGEIRPEVLEIIAFLHHREIMPMSIYTSERHPDSSAIQQPPLLSLLSSRILTSLSDAAWRAHEKLVVEEAKAMGGEYADLRPEVPGAVYRVHVAGLRPEVWLELILWSCLRGGWLIPGADILRTIIQDAGWKTISWQDYEQSIPPPDRIDSTNWADWEFVFKTRKPSTRDAPKGQQIKVTQTISAEIVNAYIDGLGGAVDLGVGNRGVPIDNVITRLRELGNFLRTQGKRLSLSTGSWDALVLRVADSQGLNIGQQTTTVQQLVSLSPGFSQGLGAFNTQGLPEYVLDGNMAMHGLLHVALSHQIASGSFEGALAVFNQLQVRTDRSRRKSLEDFLGYIRRDSTGFRPRSQALKSGGMFTSNFAGIEYPELRLQIPTTTLAGLLELATDAKAYDFGRHLMHTDDVDEAIIGEQLYEHPYVQPAVIRFAAESNDEILLAKFREMNLQRQSFREILDAQITNKNWAAARRLLQYLDETPRRTWSLANIATVIRTTLELYSQVRKGDGEAVEHLANAKAMLKDMLGDHTAKRSSNGVSSLLAVLVAADSSWANMCNHILQSTRVRMFELHPRNFNRVLEAIISAYGIAAGKHLLDIFWPPAARNAHDAARRLERNRMSRQRPAILNSVKRQRIAVQIPGSGFKNDELVFYGALAPNSLTIMIVLEHALSELVNANGGNQSDGITADTKTTETRDIVKWAVRRLAELPAIERNFVERIRRALMEKGMVDFVSDLPDIVQVVEADLRAEDDQSLDDDAVGEQVEGAAGRLRALWQHTPSDSGENQEPT